MNFIASIIESCHENLDSKYVEQKKTCQAGLKALKLMAAIVLVSSVVTTIFALSSPLGLPVVFVTLPLCYIAYNGYRMLENLQDITDNPKKYQYGWGLVPEFDPAKLAKKLRKNTILTDWLPVEDAVQEWNTVLKSKK